jgi:uncharacterized protein YcfJ
VGTAIGAAAGSALGGRHGTATGAGMGLITGTMVGAGQGAHAAADTQRAYDIAYQQCMYAKGNQLPHAYQRQVQPRVVYTQPGTTIYQEQRYYPSQAIRLRIRLHLQVRPHPRAELPVTPATPKSTPARPAMLWR